MTTDLVPVPQRSSSLEVLEIIEPFAGLAGKIARTEFVPDSLRGKPEAVLACMLQGHEVGIGPMMALSKIHVVKGRPVMAAELMRALVLRDGHEVWLEEHTQTRVTICGQRRGSDHATKVTWTMDDAKRAKLDGKDNWRQYPRAMLLARSTGELCRAVFPDVLGGISYTVEELDDGIDFEVPLDEPDATTGNGTGAEPPPATTSRRKATGGSAKTSGSRRSAPAKQVEQPPEPPLPEQGAPIDTTASEAPPEPPLPDDRGEVDEETKRRAQAIAMKCDRAGLERAHVIAAVTGGEKTSAKAVTADEASAVLMAVHEIQSGRKALDEVDGGWRIVDVSEYPGSGDVGTEPDSGAGEGEAVSGMPPSSPPSPPPPTPSPPATPGTGDEGTWDGDRWRAYVKEKGVTVTEALKQAQELAREMDAKVPTRLDEIAGNETLAGLLRGFIDEVALERGR